MLRCFMGRGLMVPRVTEGIPSGFGLNKFQAHVHLPPPPVLSSIARAPRGEAAMRAYDFHYPDGMKELVPLVVGSHVWVHILQLLRTRQDTKTTV